jgi:MFS family permease
MKDGEERPWQILLVLLVAMVSPAGNMFLYSFAMLPTAKDWGLTPLGASVIGFMPMVANPIGGILFGSLSDRYGRRHVLLLTIFLSAFSAAFSGLSFGPYDFVLYRLLLGMSLGGQWAVSMTLASEVSQAEERGRAVAIVQTSFPVGFLYASLLAFGVAEGFGWRGLLILGALPTAIAAPLAYCTIKESRLWIEDAAGEKLERVPYQEVFKGELLRHTILGTLVMFVGAFGAWSVNPWIPVYLGTLGVPAQRVPLFTFFIMVGALIGYIAFGFISDHLGRKLTFQMFFIGMAGALASFGFLPSQPWFMSEGGYPVMIVILGGSVAFFLGYFSGYGALFAELFPTRVRSRGMGFCYSLGIVGSAIGPVSTGYLSSLFGIGHAFMIASLAFLTGSILIQLFPETTGKRL